ncbi:transposase [Parapedobacter lycopersici]|uniref:transposase n=1 Tax=Parapedobacter lycopersici TaxID=1864939 RepID=UPI00333E7490
MKKIPTAGFALLLFAACNGGSNDDAEIKQLRDQAIAVHDEIMPQISTFDRNTVRIDSLLDHLPQLKQTHANLDTAQARTELTALKGKLENATDSMMEWMTDFDTDPQNKTATEIKTYYEQEIDKVTQLKQVFEEVAKESADQLAPFQ